VQFTDVSKIIPLSNSVVVKLNLANSSTAIKPEDKKPAIASLPPPS